MKHSIVRVIPFNFCAAMVLFLRVAGAQTPISVTSLAPSPTLPVQYGTTVTWTAVATGGTAPLEYQYWRYSEATGAWTEVRAYSQNPSYTWTSGVEEAGAYSLQVWVRSAGSTASYEAVRSTTLFAITVGVPAIVSSVVASTPSPAQYGTPITWTASASGGNGTLEYEFWRYCEAVPVWTQVQAYSLSASYTWTPTASDAGVCYVQARVRTVGVAVPYESTLNSAAFAVTASLPITVTSLTSAPTSSAPFGTPVIWTAVATGGIAPLQHQFWRYAYATASWVMAQDYSSDASHTWIPGPADVGTHGYQVWVRSSGSTAMYEAYRSSGEFTVADVLEPPVATPGSGTYASAQPIALTAEQGADIRYTLDGSDPLADSSLYTTPLHRRWGFLS